MKNLVKCIVLFCIPAFFLYSCTTVDLYEKTTSIPGHAWQNSFRPTFEFTIKDTSPLYQPFLVLRHNEKYNYNNIYINLYVQGPGQDTAQKFQFDLPLATNEKGWKGTGMDDIYEHRIGLDLPKHLRRGNYKFTLEQIMRENPLQMAKKDVRKKLRRATILYWTLLIYIVAALIWWFISLEKQNDTMRELKLTELGVAVDSNSMPRLYNASSQKISRDYQKNQGKYIGEGSIFLLVICVGAILVYRYVRRQFYVQQQQQNFMMAVTHELKTPIRVQHERCCFPG